MDVILECLGYHSAYLGLKSIVLCKNMKAVRISTPKNLQCKVKEDEKSKKRPGSVTLHDKSVCLQHTGSLLTSGFFVGSRDSI